MILSHYFLLVSYLNIDLIQSMVQSLCKLFDDVDQSPFSHFRQRLFPQIVKQ